MDGEHLELFVLDLQPIDDDLETNIKKYEEIHLEGERLQMVMIKIKKIIDDTRRRVRAYQLFEQERSKL